MAIFKEYKKKDGTKAWLFQAYLGIDEATGKEIRTTRRGFSTKKEAQSKLNSLLVDFESNGLQKKDTNTFQDVYLLWFESYKHTVKESTYVQVSYYFKAYIIPKLGDLRISSITTAHYQKILNEWASKLVIYKLLHNYAYRVFDYALTLDAVIKNPADRVIMPKKKNTTKEFENYYTKSELNILLDTAKHNVKYHSIIWTLAYTGLRIGELLALTWDDIDFKNKTLVVSKTIATGENAKTIIQSPKTQKSNRTISLDDQTVFVLKRWQHAQIAQFFRFGIRVKSKKQLVYTNDDGNFLSKSSVAYRLRKYIVASGLDKRISIHGLRHTHASLLCEAGASIKEAQVRLGHSDIKNTMNIYTHVSEKSKEKTADKLADYMNL